MLHLRELWLYQKRLGTWWANTSVNLSVEAGIVNAEEMLREGINLALHICHQSQKRFQFTFVGRHWSLEHIHDSLFSGGNAQWDNPMR